MVSQCRLGKLALFLHVTVVVVVCVYCEWTCMRTKSTMQFCADDAVCLEKYYETSDSCDEETIDNNVALLDSANACVVPNIKNGRMLQKYLPNANIKAGELVPNQTWAIYECDSGFNLEGRENNLCRSGSWFSTIHPICTAYCNNEDLKLNSVSFNVKCLDGDTTIPCSDRIKPGTVAKASCSTKYRIPSHYPVQSFYCDELGQWDYQPSRCEPICGEELALSQPFQVNGKVTNITSIPWHVGVYQMKGDKYAHICGGTIINAKVIISAAHCFWDNANQASYNTGLYKIGAGKFYRDYYADEAGREQFRNILKISIPNQYRGEYGGYKADISVITLTRALILSDFIAPICIEWQNSGLKYFPNNLYGTVAGWGIDESGGFSSQLKTIYVPGSSLDVCRNAAGQRLENNLADDKFCVLNTFASNPCEGDSGGGFEVKKEVNGKTLHYLWGIVSAGVPRGNTCSNLRFVSMTNIQYYEDFITTLEARNRPI